MFFHSGSGIKHASDETDERLGLLDSRFSYDYCHLVTRHIRAFFEAPDEFKIIADAFPIDAEFTCMTGFYEFNRELYWPPVCEWGYSKRTGKAYRAVHSEIDQSKIVELHELKNFRELFTTHQSLHKMSAEGI